MKKDHQAILDFAVKHSGWHGYNSHCLDTTNSIKYLESLGLLETNDLNQFRAVEK